MRPAHHGVSSTTFYKRKAKFGGMDVSEAKRLKALADPVRVQLMSMLLAEPETGVCTCDLAPAVELSEATVSHHLKQLREAGLVEGTRKGTNVYYRPQPEALDALCRVIDPRCR